MKYIATRLPNQHRGPCTTLYLRRPPLYQHVFNPSHYKRIITFRSLRALTDYVQTLGIHPYLPQSCTVNRRDHWNRDPRQGPVRGSGHQSLGDTRTRGERVRYMKIPKLTCERECSGCLNPGIVNSSTHVLAPELRFILSLVSTNLLLGGHVHVLQLIN
jgi:hypothetical protein